MYRGRGDAENRIKELKYDFGFDSFNLQSFFGTEAALTFAMIAYNLMALFRTFLLQEKTQKPLSTLRYRTFAIGAYFEKVEQWYEGIWNYLKIFEYPFKNSNESLGLNHFSF